MSKAEDLRRQLVSVATATAGGARSRPQVEDEAAERARRVRDLKRRYADLLRHYLDARNEEVLLEAYRLGREAVAHELGLLAIGEVHHDALCDVLRDCEPSRVGERCELAAVLFSELLSPYEMSSRGYREASTAMRHLNEMLEDEIRRIAHAIHDGAGQYLACVHISLYSVAKHASEEGKAELKRAHEMLDELERDLRRVSHELRPRVLENSGLAGAVEFLADGVRRRTGLDIHVEYRLGQRPPIVLETALYRCIQELLNNIVKHAEASNAWISVSDDAEGISCEVRDDGVGFDPHEALAGGGGSQLGFLGIRERIGVLGGRLDVESAPGSGARVRMWLPK